MTKRSAIVITCLLLGASTRSFAQTLDEIDRLWQQTMDALRAGQQAAATARFAEFNEKTRAYLKQHGRSWRVQYLAGSLNCQFADSRALGGKLLRDLLQNTRDLNEQGRAEVQRQLDACTAPRAGRVEGRVQIVDVSTAHFQNPGVRGDMKGGSRFSSPGESGTAISPKSPDELLARRVSLDEPQRALTAAIARLPGGAGGVVVPPFAVTTRTADRTRAEGIGRCLDAYLHPLQSQFGIALPTAMVTVYTVETTEQLYDYARNLHGLPLPGGVIAYSVPEDLSLAGAADPGACGSMAHELVHLLMKPSFAVSPAWLEEGLASEIAVATPGTARFTLNASWRDDEFARFRSSRPRVDELLELPWNAFNARNSPFGRDDSFAIQAMAAVFVRYLDARGKLDDVYATVRDQHVAPDLTGYRSYAEIVEEQLGQNLRDVDRDFDAWFGRTHGR